MITLTASTMPDIQDKAFEVGMNDYPSKPFEPNELYKKIACHAAFYRLSQVQAVGYTSQDQKPACLAGGFRYMVAGNLLEQGPVGSGGQGQ